jgi:PEP-CTERM motif
MYPTNRTALQASLSLALTLAALPHAQAQVTAMQATGNFDLNGGGLTGGNVQSFPSSSHVDVLNFPSQGSSSGLNHAYGSTAGNFGSRSSGSGVYDLSASFHIAETVTNNTAVVQNAIFNFNITPGMLMNTTTSMTGAEFVKAGIAFDIKRDGNTIWNSQAQLLTDTTGTTFTSSGTNLYSMSNPLYYQIAGGAYSVNLGTLNPGQSLSLDYVLSTLAQGNAPGHGGITVPASTFTVPGQWVAGCNKEQFAATGAVGPCNNEPRFIPEHVVTVPEHTIGGSQPGGSHGSSGDPFNIDMHGQVVGMGLADPLHGGSSITLSPVPEPSSYALALAGLVTAGWVMRRRQRILS